MNGKLEPFEVFRSQALTANAPTQFNSQFPLGKPWHSLDLYFTCAVVQGASPATGAFNENFLRLIKNISLWTPKNEYIFQNVPGRLAHVITQEAFGKGAPILEAVPATTGTYRCLIRIPLWNPMVFKPSDFILDTLGYSNMNLSIQVGSQSDLFGTVNDTTVSTTVTAVLNQEPVPLVYQQPRGEEAAKLKAMMAKYYLSYFVAGFGDPTAVGQIDLPRAADIAYYGLYFFHGEPTVSAAQPFSGITDNIGNRYTDFTLQTDVSYPLKSIRADYLRDVWQSQRQAFDAQFQPNSYFKVDFPADGQKQACLYSGDKSLLRLTWTLPGSGAASSASMLSVGAMAWRARAN
jgi:hypothetical protein